MDRAFVRVFQLCKIAPGDPVAILAESQSRALNIQLAELALQRIGGAPVPVAGADAGADHSRAGALDWRECGDRRATAGDPAEYEKAAPPIAMTRAADKIPHARHVSFDGLGHLPNIEAPVRFNRVVTTSAAG